MKKGIIFLIVATAAFLGVIAALQVDRYLERRDLEGRISGSMPARAVDFEVAGAVPADFRQAAKKIMPAVVSVDRRDLRRYLFSERVEMVDSGAGSGVIISPDGYILTNNHVVAGAAELIVNTSTGKSFKARVVGTDPQSDLAVLKIDAKGLTAAEMADSSKVEVGEWVMAIGNPFGYSNTVSVGVVSSVKRTLPAEGALLIDAIQTDAAINSGNSGGALANAQGQLIGINSAIITPNQGNIGIGFAIPVNRAKRVVDEILDHGYVRYGSPGLAVYQGAYLQDAGVRQQIAEAVGATPPSSGLIVRSIMRDGPAEEAGLQQLDVIQSIDGVSLTDPTAYVRLLSDKKAGDKVSMKVWSAGETKTVDLTLIDARSY